MHICGVSFSYIRVSIWFYVFLVKEVCVWQSTSSVFNKNCDLSFSLEMSAFQMFTFCIYFKLQLLKYMMFV